MTTVRRASLGDAAAIADVRVRSWQAAYRGMVPDAVLDALDARSGASTWERLLARPDGDVLVVDDGEVSAFCSLIPSRDADAAPGTTEIAALYVVPERWRQGLGRELVSAAVALSRARGSGSMTLWVLEENLRGRLFYEGLAFRHDGAAKTDDRGSYQLREIRYRLQL